MQKRITKNLTLKILAFLIAVFLWLIVVNIDDPVDDKTFSNIPVQVTHEEVITDNNNTYQIVDNTQEVNVTVTTQRSVLDKIKAEDILNHYTFSKSTNNFIADRVLNNAINTYKDSLSFYKMLYDKLPPQT